MNCAVRSRAANIAPPPPRDPNREQGRKIPTPVDARNPHSTPRIPRPVAIDVFRRGRFNSAKYPAYGLDDDKLRPGKNDRNPPCFVALLTTSVTGLPSNRAISIGLSNL